MPAEEMLEWFEQKTPGQCISVPNPTAANSCSICQKRVLKVISHTVTLSLRFKPHWFPDKGFSIDASAVSEQRMGVTSSSSGWHQGVMGHTCGFCHSSSPGIHSLKPSNPFPACAGCRAGLRETTGSELCAARAGLGSTRCFLGSEFLSPPVKVLSFS
ncbi:hypothetical protein WISP_02431 [Willisornis vidua]|uniref:Uncharacterized protein n=1 Tax=Willisornis vidua TaxID=1566151 RepID=A0ABQ9DZ91_9PASS|nr:hypothetical protein WISP_02431 [Willisornis vidua]